MSCPSLWVDSVFARLTATYGAQFLARYSGAKPADVKADWADKLNGFSFEAITYALDNLPSNWPPNSLQFRDLCREAPVHRYPTLPAPVVQSKPSAEMLAKLRSLADSMRGRGNVAWAHALRERDVNATEPERTVI